LAADTLTSIAGALGQVAGMLPSGGQVGRKRGFFSKLLGIAAPFLSFIPGVGPILSQVAGIASNALAGNWSGVVSGISGGLQPGGVFRSRGSSSGATLGDTSMSDSNPRSFDFGGHRATGGPVRRGRAYVLNELRPEPIVFGDDAYVHPSVEHYMNSRGGGAVGGDARLATAIEMLHAKIAAMSPGDVVGRASQSHPHIFTNTFITHAARDLRVVEWMNRRLAA
jgi:hypothetical protein